jgi:hypothetical protein
MTSILAYLLISRLWCLYVIFLPLEAEITISTFKGESSSIMADERSATGEDRPNDISEVGITDETQDEDIFEDLSAVAHYSHNAPDMDETPAPDFVP